MAQRKNRVVTNNHTREAQAQWFCTLNGFWTIATGSTGRSHCRQLRSSVRGWAKPPPLLPLVSLSQNGQSRLLADATLPALLGTVLAILAVLAGMAGIRASTSRRKGREGK